jgi:hypothetical protein
VIDELSTQALPWQRDDKKIRKQEVLLFLSKISTGVVMEKIIKFRAKFKDSHHLNSSITTSKSQPWEKLMPSITGISLAPAH